MKYVTLTFPGFRMERDSERVMANENGTWIMYGVSWEDPECLHTVDEAIEYINS